MNSKKDWPCFFFKCDKCKKMTVRDSPAPTVGQKFTGDDCPAHKVMYSSTLGLKFPDCILLLKNRQEFTRALCFSLRVIYSL